MTKLKRSLMILAGTALMAMPAQAGQVNPQVLDVDLDNMFAAGDLLTARDDKNDDVFLGCGTRNLELGDGSLYSWAFCQGQDADGDRATCFTFNPELIQTIREINSFSWVTFSWTDDGSGTLTCTRMGFSTQSQYLGKNQKGNKVPKD
ncbi:MAG: hypothetical protein HKN36_01165 [Hellea sp.]|nr:hypothetical protein [Hellea sp.]